MGREEKNELQQLQRASDHHHHHHRRRKVLVVGNYCHDVLMQDGRVIGESLGGAASFISNVLDGLSIHGDYVSKVGFDFAYSVSHQPISSPSSMTTLFHAHFSTDRDHDGNQDRTLKRIHACDPISPSELPELRFDFGLAVGVAGEITPETLERMLDICSVVFVDIQALIRVFDSIDGTVKLVDLKESGFFHLLPRIGFLKASAEEAPFVDVEEARKWCCVVVTDGKDGCRVYSKDEKLQVSPFAANQIDPTGAGDSFLGGFVAGLIQGLDVPDAALLGNFFGSMTVGHIGIPKFDLKLLEEVTDELQRKKMHHTGYCERTDVEPELRKSAEHQEFHEFLVGVTELLSTNHNENHLDSQNSHAQALYQRIHCQNNGQQKHNPVYEAALPAVDGQP